jgi:hypothetical protein
MHGIAHDSLREGLVPSGDLITRSSLGVSRPARFSAHGQEGWRKDPIWQTFVALREKRRGRLGPWHVPAGMDRVVRDEWVDKPDIGCGRFVTRGDPH